MIYTLTANPAIDYNIACDGLSANTVNRTRNAVYTPNGKGLNVSFTLNHYGVDTTILGFFAGFSGEFIVKGAEALGVPVKPVWTDGITRVNVFLNAGPDTEYNMVNAGAAINAANEQEMFELIDSLDDMTCLVISGSPPTPLRVSWPRSCAVLRQRVPSSCSISRAISWPTSLPWSRCSLSPTTTSCSTSLALR